MKKSNPFTKSLFDKELPLQRGRLAKMGAAFRKGSRLTKRVLSHVLPGAVVDLPKKEAAFPKMPPKLKPNQSQACEIRSNTDENQPFNLKICHFEAVFEHFGFPKSLHRVKNVQIPMKTSLETSKYFISRLCLIISGSFTEQKTSKYR